MEPVGANMISFSKSSGQTDVEEDRDGRVESNQKPALGLLSLPVFGTFTAFLCSQTES